MLVEDERVRLITFTGSAERRLEASRAGAAQARQPRARERDAGDRRGGRRRRGRGRPLRRERVLLRRAELHLRAADLRPARTSTTLPRRVPARGSRRSSSATRPTRTTDVGPLISTATTATACSPGSRRRAPAAPTMLTGGELEGGLLRPTVVERPPRGREALVRRGVRARLHARSRTTTLDEAIDRANATRYGLQAGIFTSSLAGGARGHRSVSSSAASRSTRRRRSAPTRCPTAASRTPATRGKARRGPSAR